MSKQFSIGDISVLYDYAALRYIRVRGIEVVRHIYFALRDQDWNTVPGRITRESIQQDRDSISIEIEVQHHASPVAFAWTGHIEIRHDGLSFEAKGEALAGFQKNRIGLCVLHPGQACAGLPVVVTHTDGQTECSHFPHFVEPHQPFRDVRAITHWPAPGIATTVSFAGEVFETEDQRNWTDGSFKTYSTPLDEPFPVAIPTGWSVHHRVSVDVATSVFVALSDQPAHVFPRLGTQWVNGTHSVPLQGLQHLRVDVLPGEESVIASAAQHGLDLEIAVHAREVGAVSQLVEAVRSAHARVARWIVYHLPVANVRHLLSGEIGAGTNANFAEWNRQRTLSEGADFGVFSANPQVHGSDLYTIVETLEGQGDAVRSALQFAPKVVVSPVTLLPRFNAVATSGGAASEPPADPRQNTPFTAAWLLGSIAALAGAGAASITYFEAGGPRGIAGTPAAEVFARIAAFQPQQVLPMRSSDPLRIAVLGLQRDQVQLTAIANLTAESCHVRLAHLEHNITLEGYEIQWIEH